MHRIPPALPLPFPAPTPHACSLFDIVFYANSLFSATVLGQIGFGSSAPLVTLSQADLAKLAAGSCIVAAMGVPGYFVALALIDRMGRRAMQLMGFAAIAILYAALAGSLRALVVDHIVPVFVVLYGLSFFFSNFGANTTTFVIPAESFATKAKATCHGISAASGKIGAAVGAAIMQPILGAFGSDPAGKDKGLQVVLAICAGVSVAGFIVTWLLTVESRDIRIEDLDNQLRAAEGGDAATTDMDDVRASAKAGSHLATFSMPRMVGGRVVRDGDDDPDAEANSGYVHGGGSGLNGRAVYAALVAGGES